MRKLVLSYSTATSVWIVGALLVLTSCEYYMLTPKEEKPPEEVGSLAKGLIGHYSFDGNVLDSSKSLNHAIDHSSSKYAQGVRGQALFFDGKNDYLEIENTIPASIPLSFSFWVNSQGAVDDAENNGAIISKYSFDRKSFYITTFGFKDTRNEDRIHASFFGNDGDSNRERDWASSNLSNDFLNEGNWDVTQWNIINPTEIELDAWTHVVVNMSDSTLSLYIDGKLAVEKQREYELYFDSEESTYIGNIFNGGEGNNNHLHGYLDELRIYERALTDKEINALHHCTIP